MNGDLLGLAFAETINGMPAQEFFEKVPPLYDAKVAETD